MRILEVTSDLDGGGVDRLLYDYCRRMIQDISFDFIVTSTTTGILEQPLIDLGCRVFHIPQFNEGIRKHNKEFETIVKNGGYDIIHDHSGYKAFFNLWVAKKQKVKVRIAHSHQAFMVESARTKLIRKIITPFTKAVATDLFACGIDAAKWMWGESEYNNNNVYIMTNAINAKDFSFNEHVRREVRNELGLEGKMVIGNVARFSYQKNHEFLLRMFSHVVRERPDARLVLIGRGELYDEMKELADSLGLSDKVLFLGVRNDVPRLLNGLDLFVLPSRFEGLPVTLVEIQANGLPAMVADSVTTEIRHSEKLKYYPLSDGEIKWAEECCRFSLTRGDNGIIHTNYDLDYASNDLKEKYISMADST